LENLLSNVLIKYNNELDVTYYTPYGEIDPEDFLSKTIIKYREEFVSSCLIPVCNEVDVWYSTPYGEAEPQDFPSSVIIKARSNLYSKCKIPFYNTLDASFNVPIAIGSPSDLSSFVKIANRFDLNSRCSIPEYNSLDVSSFLIQPPTTTINFSVLKDTFIREARPTLNYGSSQSLVVGDALEGRYYALLQIDFSRLKNYTDIYIEEVDLILKIYALNSLNVDIYEVGGDWSETGLTWASAQNLPLKYIKSFQVVDGINEIDLRDYVRVLIDEGKYVVNILLKTNEDGYINIASKEAPDETITPKLSVTFRNLYWDGYLEETDFYSSAYLVAQGRNNFYSVAVLKNGSHNFNSSVIVSDPSSRLSKVIISRYFINCKARFVFKQDFNSSALIQQVNQEHKFSSKAEIKNAYIKSRVDIRQVFDFISQVGIPETGVVKDTPAHVTIIREWINSTVNIVIKNDFNSTAIIQKVNQEHDFTSQVEIKNAYIQCKAYIYSSYPFYSTAILGAKGEPVDLLSTAEIKNAYILSKAKFRFNYDFSSTAFLHNFINNDFNSSVIIKREFEYSDIALKVLILTHVDFNASAIIQRVNEEHDFDAQAEIKNAYILSKARFRLFNDLDAVVNIRQIYNFNSKVFIRQKYDFNSEVVIRQFDVSEKMSKVYINSNNYVEYLPAIVKIRVSQEVSLNCRATVHTTARFWRPNTYGGLRYNRRLPI
jgi:hypothetical protein